MELLVNGKVIKNLPDRLNLSELLREMKVDATASGIAIAVELEVMPRSKWQKTELKSGDRVEIIHAVQGG